MSFKQNGYCVSKTAISKELANFCYEYLKIKRTAVDVLFRAKYIGPYTDFMGTWKDPQAPQTYSHYGDSVMETLLLKLKPLMEKETGLKLFETYSYCRLYKRGDVLKKHKDRHSCEISTTMHLGGEKWPIHVEGVKVNLNVGDMLIYRGCELLHWRDRLEGNDCAQVFLHYNDASKPDAELNRWDGRPHLGLPASLKIKR